MTQQPWRVRVAPRRPDALLEPIAASGAVLADQGEPADLLVWTATPQTGIDEELTPTVRWVQLQAAGVETWVRSDRVRDGRTWLSASGVYAEHVAERAVASLLAGCHGLVRYARGAAQPIPYRPLHSRKVAVIGGGGIGQAVGRRLTALGAKVLVVDRTPKALDFPAVFVSAAEAGSVWGRVDDIVLCVPATPETAHLVDEVVLRALPQDGCVVNVGRGEALDTDALARVLHDGHLAAAVLDVVDPEPLPAEHPLWQEPAALITAHSANPTTLRWPALAARVVENLNRIARGDEPVGVIDVDRGY